MRSGRSSKAFVVFNGYSDLPFVGLALGLIGALAVVTLATQIDQTRLAPAFRWLGEHSIVIYLAFFLPMAASRAVLMKSGIITDVGTISLLVTLAGITAPIALYFLVQWTGVGKFLFERPAWARIDGRYRSRERRSSPPSRTDERARRPSAVSAFNASGISCTIVSSDLTAGSSPTRRCSQLRSVPIGILSAFANSSCVMPSFSRTSLRRHHKLPV